MSSPYYDEGGITIYHGDCRDVLPTVQADVLVTDPPYGVAFEGKVTKHTTVKSGGYTTEDDGSIGPDVVRMVLPMVKRGAVFSGIRNLMAYPTPRDIGCVYCPSGAGRGPWGFTCFNPVLFYGKRPGPCVPSSIMSFDVSPQNGHPCPKPLRWIKWLVALTSVDGDVIVDPFGGSGTTGRACKDLGRRCILIEREERYCEIAAHRLSQEVFDLEVV